MIARLFTAFVFLFVATSAHAEIAWSAAGTACVPTGETVGKYESINAAGVQPAGTQVGSFVFTCSMDRFDTATTAWVLRMSYRDSTGTTNTASVVARLYRLAIGSYTPVLVDTVSSNASAVTMNNTIASTESFTHTFDFEENVYFVRLTLTRSTGSQVVRLYSILLEAK